MHSRLVPLFALSFVVALPAAAQTSAAAPKSPAQDSARTLVQSFYTWYVPRAAKPGKTDMVMMAATHGPLPFDTTMTHWLRIDSTARARAKGEVDGLDGDPYLNSQDPCKTYTAKAVRPSHNNYLVDVVGSGGCTAHAKADVVVEIGQQGGHWTMIDFHDPSRKGEGLIPLLKVLHPKAK